MHCFKISLQNEKFQCEFYLPSLTFEQVELKLYLSFGSNYIDVNSIGIAFTTYELYQTPLQSKIWDLSDRHFFGGGSL